MNGFKSYLDALSDLNGLGKGTPVSWYFHPGMLLYSRDKWWGDFKFRATPHEGIDITYFSTDGTEIEQFTPETRVPAWKSGRVAGVCNDFLGKSILVEPEIQREDTDWRNLHVYAHVTPSRHIREGVRIRKNESIARVCDTIKNRQLPPHLHLSCFQIPRNRIVRDLNWNFFSTSPDIVIFNPCTT